MQSSDRAGFIQRLVVLSELFGKPLSPAIQVLYYEALQDLDPELLARAMKTSAQTCIFMPKPADLRKLVLGSDEDAAERAWMVLRLAMGTAGAYASLIIDDPALADAITAVFGGWVGACSAELSPEMWASKRKEFGRVYHVCAARGLIGSRYLAGICEQQNSGRRDWLASVPVKRLSGLSVETLSFSEAEQQRTTIAASSHGFTRFVSDGRIQATERDETA